MVGEGNFVATLNRARWQTQDLCQVDLFRLEDGMIVEHRDSSEPVPPREEWVNSGKF
jgi:predicted SnoaL-like aldol condensation-catalyzing enzyme